MYQRFFLLTILLFPYASLSADTPSFTNLAAFEKLSASEQVQVQKALIEQYEASVQKREGSSFLEQLARIGIGSSSRAARKLNNVSKAVLQNQKSRYKRNIFSVAATLLGLHALLTGLYVRSTPISSDEKAATAVALGFFLCYHAFCSTIFGGLFYGRAMSDHSYITSTEISRIDTWKAMIQKATDIGAGLKGASTFGTIEGYARVAQLLEGRIRTTTLQRLAVAGVSAAALAGAATLLYKKVWGDHTQPDTADLEN